MQVSIKCKDSCRPRRKGKGTTETFEHWNHIFICVAFCAVEPGNSGYKVTATSDAQNRNWKRKMDQRFVKQLLDQLDYVQSLQSL